MRFKTQRETLSPKTSSKRTTMCAPPGIHERKVSTCRSERCSLCALKKASLSIEAALILPFFLSILLAFFSLFEGYSTAASLYVQAAAEAKQLGCILGGGESTQQGDVTIYKTGEIQPLWIFPFEMKQSIVQKAVCRAWCGFTELECEEIYVYVTPNGSVYHLYSDCTHLKLSVQTVTLQRALQSENQYGQSYRACRLCKKSGTGLVYITKEGDCYHWERSCGGLKRTVRQVLLSEVQGRSCCLRCAERGGEQ